MSAEELRRARDEEYQQRRIRQAWVAALGGRSGLAAPMTRTRILGGVQPPSIGTVSEIGEIVTFNQPTITATTSDDYPVQIGGAPLVVCQVRIVPTADIELEVWRNGAPIENPIIIPVGVAQVVMQFTTVYVPLDTGRMVTTDPGVGAAGLVVAWQFRPSLT